MLTLFIIGVTLIFIGLIVSMSANAKPKDFMVGMFVCFLLFTGVIIVCVTSIEIWNPQPDAIDVYRNKTELQITYKVVGIDTLSRDTTIVFK